MTSIWRTEWSGLPRGATTRARTNPAASPPLLHLLGLESADEGVRAEHGRLTRKNFFDQALVHVGLAVENARLTLRQQRFADELAEKVAAATARLRELDQAKTGLVTAVPVRKQGAAMLSSLVEADGLIDLDEKATEIAPGDAVRFLPLPQVF